MMSHAFIYLSICLFIYLLQVSDLDVNGNVNTTERNLLSTPITPRTGQMTFTGFPVSNLQEIEFSVDNYLGSAYWEASKFLDRLQQVN